MKKLKNWSGKRTGNPHQKKQAARTKKSMLKKKARMNRDSEYFARVMDRKAAYLENLGDK